jgi:single-strand DNA-binding protein
VDRAVGTIVVMNDIITIRGIVATAPRHFVTGTGLSITSFRLASPSRRWDRATSAWVNGDTNWFTVTAFRTLATNVHESVVKGDRVLVAGRLRIRPWERENRSGTAVEIDGDSIGHDLAFGRSQWRKVTRHTTDETAGPGEHPTAEERAAAAAAGLQAGSGLEGRLGSDTQAPDGVHTGPASTGGVPLDPELHDRFPHESDLRSDRLGGTAGSGPDGADDWTAHVGADGVVPDGVGLDDDDVRGVASHDAGITDDGVSDDVVSDAGGAGDDVSSAKDDWPAPAF